MKIAYVLLAMFALRVGAAEPADLAKARDAYRQSSERALAPVKAAYSKELTRMIDAYTRAGKLDDAIAVKNELAKLTGSITTPMACITACRAGNI